MSFRSYNQGWALRFGSSLSCRRHLCSKPYWWNCSHRRCQDSSVERWAIQFLAFLRWCGYWYLIFFTFVPWMMFVEAMRTVFGTVSEVRWVQWAKAPLSMVCNLDGRVSSVRLLQELKALAPMVRNDLGRLTRHRQKHPEKARRPMVRNTPCMFTSLSRGQLAKA